MINALVVYRLLMSCGTRMTEIVQYACFASICCLIFSNFLINKWQFNLKGLYLCVNK